MRKVEHVKSADGHCEAGGAASPVQPAERSSRLVIVLVLLSAVTSSWTAVRVSGLNLSDLFIALSLFTMIIDVMARRLPLYVPLWSIGATTVGLLLLGRDVIILNRGLLADFAGDKWTTGSALGNETAGPLLFVARLFLATTAVAILVINLKLSTEKKKVIMVVAAWIAGIAISAFYAVLVDLGVLNPPSNLFQSTSERSSGLAFHPNSFGQAVSLALPVMPALIALAKSGILKLGLFVALAIMVTQLIASDSRAALLLGLPGLIFVVFIRLWQGPAKKLALPLGLILGLALYVVVPKVLAGTRLMNDDQGAATSTDIRLSAIEAGWQLFASNPIFGSALGAWLGESVPLMLLTSGGGLFVFAYYVFLLRPLRIAWPFRRDAIIGGLLASSLVLVAYGALNNGLSERYLFWGLVAATCLTQRDRLNQIRS